MHAPEEGLRMLGTAMDKAAMHAPNWRACWRPKALPMKSNPGYLDQRESPAGHWPEHGAIKAEKQDFIKTVIPQWEEQAVKTVC